MEGLIADGKDDLASKLGDCFRYIDDLLGLNDEGYIAQIFSEMYPEELTLNQTNSISNLATYLDTNICVENGKFQTSLYDKRNDFGFKVISLPHMSSNVPNKSSYSVYYSQINRLLKANSNYTGFVYDVNNLSIKLLKQGYVKSKLNYYLNKFLRNKFTDITFKYWSNFSVTDFSF